MVTQLIADVESSDSDVRSLALRQLKELGPAAASAVPALIAGMEKVRGDHRLVCTFADTLGAIGAEAGPAVPHLVTLVNPDEFGSPAVALAILKIGGEPAQERLAMRSLLRAKVVHGWWDAHPIDLWTWAKEPMRTRADRIIPHLAELLADSDEYIRTRARMTLARYGSRAATVVPALVAALNHPEPGVRTQVALALAAVEPGRKSEAIAALIPLLTNPEAASSVRDALRQFGDDAVAQLLPLLQKHTGEAQMPYIRALQSIGEPSIPGLRQELRGSRVAGRAGAARTLGLIGSHAQAAFEDLLTALQDPDAEVRGEAAMALVRIDASRASPAVPHLIACLDSRDAWVREVAATALTHLGGAAVPALPFLRKALSDPEIGLVAARAMVVIDPGQAADAVPVLVDALRRRLAEPASGDVPEEMLLEALVQVGSAAAAAAPTIRQALRSSKAAVRCSAARALVRVTPECIPEMVPTLVGLVEEASDLASLGDPSAFFTALDTLAEIGPAAGQSAPRLEAILLDEEKRQIWDPMSLFSTLVKMDPTAADRMRARLEADLQSSDRFDRAAELLSDLGSGVPATWAPLLETARNKAEEMKVP